MTAADHTQLETFFADYTHRFAGADGRLHPMQQLKVDHSRRVVENAVKIMSAEGWPRPQRLLGSACALLHDVGRFSQYAQFATFEDQKSFNHAARGAQVLQEEGALETLSVADREAILVSVRHHNAREIPAALPVAQTELLHLVRDADKLDIFRVFEDAVREGHLEDHPEIAWSLPERGPVNPALLEAVSAGRTVSYSLVHSLCDFVLIQVGWLRSLLHYDATVALADARGALAFREQFVRATDDSPDVRACFDRTRAAMRARLHGG